MPSMVTSRALLDKTTSPDISDKKRLMLQWQ
jgi:hypothetical protein